MTETSQAAERARSALTTLSTVGAAIAGAGVGALLASAVAPIAWWVVGVGLTSHLVGMVGVRRLLLSGGYQVPAWQRVAYWLCWAAVAAVTLYALLKAVG